jgi:hypothetical protein
MADTQPTDTESFEYMLLEKDPDHYRTVFSGPSQISPWIDPSMLNLKHRIGRGPFGDVWIATHHQRTEDYDRYHEVAVKMLHPVKDDQLQLFSARFDEIFGKCQGLGDVCFLHGVSTQNGRVCPCLVDGVLVIPFVFGKESLAIGVPVQLIWPHSSILFHGFTDLYSDEVLRRIHWG